MPARTVTGSLVDLNADPAAGVRLSFKRSGVVAQDGDVVLPDPVEVTTASGGTFSIDLLPGNYSAFARTSRGPLRFTFSLASDGSTDLAELLDEATIVATPDAVTQARAARDEAIAAVAAVPLTRDAYSTVAALLADTILTNANTVLGQIIWAGGFRYERAASNASDHHVTTAGGVKLYVLPGADGRVSLAAFGKSLDGTVDVSAELAAAIAIGSAIVTAPEGSNIGLDANVTLRSNLILDFKGCTLTSLSGTRYLDPQGTAGTSANLYANAVRNRHSFQSATKSLFVAGDWVCLVNSPNVDNDSTSKGRSQQLVRVVSVATSDPNFDEVTIDRALAHTFTATAVATPAAAHKITAPIENVEIIAKAFVWVTTRPKLARTLRIVVDESGAAGAVQMANENPIACDGGIIQTRAEAAVGAASGPNALVEIRSWHDLEVRISTYGGREDGVRLYNCSRVRGWASATSYAGRGVNLYKLVNSYDFFPVAENGTITGGNVEHVLFDYCEDVSASPRVINFQSGDGIELRGRIKNIKLIDPVSIARAGSTVATCIHVHPASLGQTCENVQIIGGYVSGYIAKGVASPDGVDGLRIIGLKAEPLSGATEFVPISVNPEGGFNISQNVIIRECTLIGAGASPIGAYGSVSLRATNVKFIDNLLGVPSGLTASLVADYVDGFEMRGTRYTSIPSGHEIRVHNCTGVRLRDNERPSETFKYSFTNSVGLEGEGLSSIDTPASFLALVAKPVILDSFTDSDSTAIASHVPEVGGFTWLETSGPNATILSNRLRITTNGNLVYTDAGVKNFDALLTVFYVTSATKYSFVFDRADASNYAEVEFDSGSNTIKLIETVAASPTNIDTYSAWPSVNNTIEGFRVRVVGSFVEVFRGEVRILSGSLASLNGATTVGWLRTSASTNESILSAIGIVGL